MFIMVAKNPMIHLLIVILYCFYISYTKQKTSRVTIDMSPALEIANYKVENIPNDFERVIKDFVFMRRHKQISVQKPVLDFNATDKEWYDPDQHKSGINFFRTEEEQYQEKIINNKILLQSTISNYLGSKPNANYNPEKKPAKSINHSEHNPETIQSKFKHETLKKKIIKKVSKWTPNQQKQRIIQKMHCKYLLNSLQKSNLLSISQNIPPNLSVLQTIEDGDYLLSGERKEYPHYSNVIQPIHLPAVMLENTRVIREPVRLQMGERIFLVQDNTLFKVKHVFMLLKELFDESVKNCSMIRQMNFRGDTSLRLQNENHYFEKLAAGIGLNFKACKVLFDMLNDHYDLQKELALGRSDDYKLRVAEELKQLLQKQIGDYFGNKRMKGQVIYSCFTPVKEYYLSLRDLRDIFMEVHAKAK